MKRLETLHESLKDTGISPEEVQPITRMIDKVAKARSDARLQIVVRSGVIICQNKQTASIEQYYEEVKKAKCLSALPKSLTSRLDAMKGESVD